MHCVPSAKEVTDMAKITIKELYYAHASVEPCKTHRQMSLYYRGAFFFCEKYEVLQWKFPIILGENEKFFLNTPAKWLKLSNNIEDM